MERKQFWMFLVENSSAFIFQKAYINREKSHTTVLTCSPSDTCFGFPLNVFYPKNIFFFIRTQTPEGGKKMLETHLIFRLIHSNLVVNFCFSLFPFFSLFNQQNRTPQKGKRNSLWERATEPQAYLCSFWYKNMCKIFFCFVYIM